MPRIPGREPLLYEQVGSLPRCVGNLHMLGSSCFEGEGQGFPAPDTENASFALVSQRHFTNRAYFKQAWRQGPHLDHCGSFRVCLLLFLEQNDLAICME